MCEMFHKLPLHVKGSKTKGRSFVLNGRRQGFVRLKPDSGETLLPKSTLAPMLGNRPKRE
jgi:hypothetical protein